MAERVGGDEVEHVCVNNAAGFVYLANLDTLTFHTWLSRRDKLGHPDRLV